MLIAYHERLSLPPFAPFAVFLLQWPPTLYDVRKIITAVIEQHGKDPKGHEILMETLGELCVIVPTILFVFWLQWKRVLLLLLLL
jgi:hypothetical protein